MGRVTNGLTCPHPRTAPKASSSVHKNGKPTHEYNIYSFFKATTPRPKSLLQCRGGGGGRAAEGSSRGVGGIGGIGEDSALKPQCFRLQELWDWFDQVCVCACRPPPSPRFLSPAISRARSVFLSFSFCLCSFLDKNEWAAP